MGPLVSVSTEDSRLFFAQRGVIIANGFLNPTVDDSTTVDDGVSAVLPAVHDVVLIGSVSQSGMVNLDLVDEAAVPP